jgi:FkbM family methyltransferase
VKSSFGFRQSGIRLLFGLLRVGILRRVVKTNRKLFLPAADVISLEPLTFDSYEIGITELIQYYQLQGYREAFIDIGANIGLSTVYCGENFESAFCFEPNPALVNILKTNTRDLPCRVNIYNYGISNNNGYVNLKIPNGNFGGGFIDDESNALSNKELALKDGSSLADLKNMPLSRIQVKKGSEVLKPIFSSLPENGKVVIKIDVEGYERVVLQELALALNSRRKVVVLFENFSDDIKIEFLSSIFPGLKSVGTISTNLDKFRTKILKGFWALFFGRRYYLDETPSELKGQVIMVIN